MRFQLGELTALPQPPSWILGGPTSKGGEKKGRGRREEGREGVKRKGKGRRGTNWERERGEWRQGPPRGEISHYATAHGHAKNTQESKIYLQ